MRRPLVVIVLAAALAFALGFALGRWPGGPLAKPKPSLALKHEVSCGVERAAVKHLTDGFVLPLAVTPMTPDELIAMAPPAVTADSPRLPVEQQVVELEDVHVIAAKQEADSDLHVILVDSTGVEMNVEAPMAACESGPYGAVLGQARAAMDAAMPNVSSRHYTPENLTADIVGMVFFDVLHGQRGAPNGIELHPVTYFSVVSP